MTSFWNLRDSFWEPQDLILDPLDPILDPQGPPGRSLGDPWDAPGTAFWSSGDRPGPPQRAILQFDQILNHFGYQNVPKMGPKMIHF